MEASAMTVRNFDTSLARRGCVGLIETLRKPSCFRREKERKL